MGSQLKLSGFEALVERSIFPKFQPSSLSGSCFSVSRHFKSVDHRNALWKSHQFYDLNVAAKEINFPVS